MILKATPSQAPGEPPGMLLHNEDHTCVYKTTNDEEITYLQWVLRGVSGFLFGSYVNRKLDIAGTATAQNW